VLFEKITHLRDPQPHLAALNMAIDEVLLGRAQEPVVRVYRWQRAAVSFGYFGKYAAIASAWAGRELVRRMTGGGVVPHGEDVTYSLIAPSGHAFAEQSPRTIYRAVHEAIATLLVSIGETPEFASAPGRAGADACFESPAEFDLLAHGRKIAGAALRRTRDGLLLQGSLQTLTAPDIVCVRLPEAFAAQVVTREIAPQEFVEAESLARSKYATREWTERV